CGRACSRCGSYRRAAEGSQGSRWSGQPAEAVVDVVLGVDSVVVLDPAVEPDDALVAALSAVVPEEVSPCAPCPAEPSPAPFSVRVTSLEEDLSPFLLEERLSLT